MFKCHSLLIFNDLLFWKTNTQICPMCDRKIDQRVQMQDPQQCKGLMISQEMNRQISVTILGDAPRATTKIWVFTMNVSCVPLNNVCAKIVCALFTTIVSAWVPEPPIFCPGCGTIPVLKHNQMCTNCLPKSSKKVTVTQNNNNKGQGPREGDGNIFQNFWSVWRCRGRVSFFFSLVVDVIGSFLDVGWCFVNLSLFSSWCYVLRPIERSFLYCRGSGVVRSFNFYFLVNKTSTIVDSDTLVVYCFKSINFQNLTGQVHRLTMTRWEFISKDTNYTPVNLNNPTRVMSSNNFMKLLPYISFHLSRHNLVFNFSKTLQCCLRYPPVGAIHVFWWVCPQAVSPSKD